MHFGTRRKINLCSDELLMGPFSHSLIFCWSSLVNSNYWIKMRWEIRTDPYLFYSFSFSEKVHADNYERVLRTLGHEVKPNQIEIEVLDTKSNLQKAAQKELMKITTTYGVTLDNLTSSDASAFIRQLQTAA